MNKWVLVIWAILFFPFNNLLKAQSISNEGTEFWAVFPTHVPSNTPRTNVPRLADIAIFVTSKYETEVTVTCGSYSKQLPVHANQVTTFKVDRDQAYIELSDADRVLPGRGIHVQVTPGKPSVSAYAHIYAGQRSAASLLLPLETLGQKYYSMNYAQTPGAHNFLVLVAAEDNTKLIIHKKDQTVINVDLPLKGDVYEYTSSDDLTGVYIDNDPATPCRRFAVFSGSTMIAIGGCQSNQLSYDPLYQQLYAVNSWGKNYGVVPFIDRKYILRVVAQADGTTFKCNGQTYDLLKAGDYQELGPFTTPTFIAADKLVSVAQYSLTQSCSGANGSAIIGDPDMVILNPIEFSVKNITVFSSENENILSRYINVLIKANRAASFKINGVAPVVAWKPLTGNEDYVYAQIQVVANSLTLTADEGFNAIAYGFGDAESYAYSAGTNLASNNFLSIVNKSLPANEYPNGCVGELFDLKITLPYQVSSLQWVLDGVVKVETGAALTPEVRTLNGDPVYVYTLSESKQYLVKGHHEMEVTASIIPDAANCNGGDPVLSYTFDIYDLPTAKFETESVACATAEIPFTDQSNSNTNDFPITEWLWDFGDGSYSQEQNPKHAYAEGGDYTIKLTVKSGVVCASTTFSQNITINPLPPADFTIQNSGAVSPNRLTSTCVNTNVTLVDKSPAPLPTEQIVEWIWNFGDGNMVVRNDNSSQIHVFTSVGRYTVSLTTKSAKGCLSIPAEYDIEVTTLPKAKFSLPDVCLADGTATFTNLSINADGGTNGLRYLWDFGDPGSASNTSTSKDGLHAYGSTGVYIVKLIVRNDYGCEHISVQDFTVNGGVRKAAFTVQNESNLCSDKPVIINNTSIAEYGRITKIEIYKDLNDASAAPELILYPDNSDISLTYPAFGGNAPKDYTIRLRAYSGISCVENYDKTITLYPRSELAFAAIPAVCENDGLIPITQASEISGMSGGGGVYSGSYVAGGYFNAKAAGAGQHPVIYTYSSDKGCPVSITGWITVYPSPKADAGSTTYVLAGGTMKMNATATIGSGVTYQWSPGINLDRADVLNPMVTPDRDTQYTLTVRTPYCSTTSTVMVRVLDELKPANAFSPNGDNVNDYWELKYLNTYPKATVQIFNRYGQIIFSSEGYSSPFDGNYQGKPLPVGTYYYIITPNNGRKRITGSLTLIR